MIQVRLSYAENPIYLVGIAVEDVRRMRARAHIRVDLDEIGGHGTVFIMTSPDLAEMPKKGMRPDVELGQATVPDLKDNVALLGDLERHLVEARRLADETRRFHRRALRMLVLTGALAAVAIAAALSRMIF